MSSTFHSIRLEVEGSVATLTLNRPDRLNSFTDAMHAEVRLALDSVRASGSIRALVVTGAGRGFCAGQDLNDRKVSPGGEPVDLGASIEKNYKPLVLALRSLPIPVIAAVNGVAAGAGANIALACDVVVAARSASFVQAFSRLGLIPDAGGTYFLTRRVGVCELLFQVPARRIADEIILAADGESERADCRSAPAAQSRFWFVRILDVEVTVAAGVINPAPAEAGFRGPGRPEGEVGDIVAVQHAREGARVVAAGAKRCK